MAIDGIVYKQNPRAITLIVTGRLRATVKLFQLEKSELDSVMANILVCMFTIATLDGDCFSNNGS